MAIDAKDGAATPDNGRPRILFVINSIGTGGAERALDTILRAAPARLARYESHLVLLDRDIEHRALPALDARHCLEAGGRLLPSIVRLDRLIAHLRPALVVSLLVRSNVAAAIAGRHSGTATVLCERMHLGSHLAGRYRGLRLAALRCLPRLLYSRADIVLSVSEGVRRDLVEGFGVPAAITRTIPNPYDLAAIRYAAAARPTLPVVGPYCVAVGRMVAAKGFDDLIAAYAEVRPEETLVILGDGPERGALVRQVAALGLGDRVLMPGFLTEPFPVVARARYLISASRNEGFPNAIAEAMALGRPILSTDCPSGPAELLAGQAGPPGSVTQGRYGLLVPERDRAALAHGMRVLADPQLRDDLGARSRVRMEDFTAARIAALHWDLFDSLTPDGEDPATTGGTAARAL